MADIIIFTVKIHRSEDVNCAISHECSADHICTDFYADHFVLCDKPEQQQ